MKKHELRLGSALLTAACLTGNLLTPAFAEEAQNSQTADSCPVCLQPWNEDGYCAADYAVQDENGNFGTGLQPAELTVNPEDQQPAYRIDNAGELAWFAAGLQAGTLLSENAFLTADIDWSVMPDDFSWIPMGSWAESVSESPYNGNFDGNGWSISNVTLGDTADGSAAALFGEIGSGAQIRELGLKHMTVSVQNTAYAAILSGRNLGTITDCYVTDSSVESSVDGGTISDLAAVNEGSIQNCYSTAQLSVGNKADGTQASVSAVPVTGNLQKGQNNPSLIFNNYYYDWGTETEAPDSAMAAVISTDDLKSGKLTWLLNHQSDGNLRMNPVWVQTLLTQDQQNAGMVQEDPAVGRVSLDENNVETRESGPVYRVAMEYAGEGTISSELYTNGTVSFASLPSDVVWQRNLSDGQTVTITEDFTVEQDLILTQQTSSQETTAPDQPETPPEQQKQQLQLTITLANGTSSITADGQPLDLSDFTVIAYLGETPTAVDGIQLSFFDMNGQPVGVPSEAGSYQVQAVLPETEQYLPAASAALPFMITAQECQHINQATRVTAEATCMQPGTEEIYCVDCGVVLGTQPIAQLAHSFTNYQITQEATCQSNAVKTASCDYGCGTTDSREVADSKLDHKFTNYQITQEATCQSNAVETASCDYGCGTTDSREVADSKTDHKFTAYTITKEATCTENAVETATCDYGCGTTDSREVADSALGHDYKNGICTRCSVEDPDYDDQAAALIELPDSTLLTPDANGSVTGWCPSTVALVAPDGYLISLTIDGTFKAREIVMLQKGDNQITYYLKKGNGTPKACTVTLKVDVQAPTVKISVGNDVIVSNTDRMITNIQFNTVLNSNQEVTIQSDDADSGVLLIEYVVTDNVMNDQESASADWQVYDSSTPIRLTKDGNYVIYARATDNVGNAALANTNGFVIDTTAPEIAGVEEGKTYCPGTEVTITDANGIASVTVNGTAATLSADGKIAFTAAGSQKIVVTDNAGNSTTVTFQIRADHVWDSGRVTKTASCQEEGTTTYTCTECRTTKTEPIQKVAHKFTNYVYNNDATCAADGTKTAKCDYNCGTENTVTAEGTKLEHSFTNYVYNNDATCTEDGTKTAVCDHGCGEKDTVTAEGTKLGHSFTNYVYNNDATCTEDGTKTAVCDHGCGEKDTVAAEGTKLGHSFTKYEYNNDATCTEDGTKTAVCDHGCGEKDTVTAEGTKLGHNFVNYIYNNDATCTEDGTKTSICSRCGAEDKVTAEGTKLGHSFTNYVYNNDATCTEDGTKTAVCDHGCGEKDTVTAEGTKLGHSFTNYVYNNDASCQKDGTKTAKCDRGCGTTDTLTAPGTMIPHTYGADGKCTMCGQLNPALATTETPTTAPTVSEAPTTANSSINQILGIEDNSGLWGMLLVAAGALVILIAATVFVVTRKKR